MANKRVITHAIILILLFGIFLTGQGESLSIHLVDDHYVSADATAFFTQHNNKSKTHSSKEFENLKYCPDLLALDLSHNEIIDLSFLRYCPKLKILLLGDNDIVDISPIADLHDLKYLELFKNKIPDFNSLAELDKLIDLNVCFNKCKDLTPLYKLTGLERLWIYNSNGYSANYVDATDLRAALPNTYVDSTSYSTLGGWRTHPRYFLVRDIFRKYKKYIPWKGVIK